MTKEIEDRDQDDFIPQEEDYYENEDVIDREPEEEILEEYEDLNFDPDKEELERHQDIPLSLDEVY